MTRQEILDEVWSVMRPLMPTVIGRSRTWTDHRLTLVEYISIARTSVGTNGTFGNHKNP